MLQFAPSTYYAAKARPGHAVGTGIDHKSDGQVIRGEDVIRRDRDVVEIAETVVDPVAEEQVFRIMKMSFDMPSADG